MPVVFCFGSFGAIKASRNCFTKITGAENCMKISEKKADMEKYGLMNMEVKHI